MLESLEETNNVNDATIALDNGNTSKAISLCYDELGATYKSIVTGIVLELKQTLL